MYKSLVTIFVKVKYLSISISYLFCFIFIFDVVPIIKCDVTWHQPQRQTPVSRSDALSPSFSPISRVISAACLVRTSLGQGGERTVWLQQITRVPHPTHPTESHARTCAQTHTYTLETPCTQTHQQNRPVSPKHGANFEAYSYMCSVLVSPSGG